MNTSSISTGKPQQQAPLRPISQTICIIIAANLRLAGDEPGEDIGVESRLPESGLTRRLIDPVRGFVRVLDIPSESDRSHWTSLVVERRPERRINLHLRLL